MPGRGGAPPRGPLRLRGRASRAPSYEAPLRYAGRYRRAVVTQCVRPRTALAGKQANVPLPPRTTALEEKQTKQLNTLQPTKQANALAVVKTTIVKTETKPSERASRRPFDGSGLLTAAAKARHVQWREARREKARQAKQAFLLKQRTALSSVEDLDELGVRVVADLKALEQRERQVARRLYNRASAKLSSQRRTSYLADLKTEGEALQTTLNLRLAQVDLLRRVIRNARCPIRVKTEPMVIECPVLVKTEPMV